MEAGVVAISFFFIRLVHLILAKPFDWTCLSISSPRFVIPSIFVYRKVMEIPSKVFSTSEKGVRAPSFVTERCRPCALTLAGQTAPALMNEKSPRTIRMAQHERGNIAANQQHTSLPGGKAPGSTVSLHGLQSTRCSVGSWVRRLGKIAC